MDSVAQTSASAVSPISKSAAREIFKLLKHSAVVKLAAAQVKKPAIQQVWKPALQFRVYVVLFRWLVLIRVHPWLEFLRAVHSRGSVLPSLPNARAALW